MEVMNLVTPILTVRIMTPMTQTLTMQARVMLMIDMMPTQTGVLMLLIMMDSDNSEDNTVNGDSGAYKNKDYALIGDTDADGFCARSNSVSTYNTGDDIDAADTDADNSYAVYNGNCDPYDTNAQHFPTVLSSVVHRCLSIVSLVGYVHLKP